MARALCATWLPRLHRAGPSTSLDKIGRSLFSYAEGATVAPSGQDRLIVLRSPEKRKPQTARRANLAML
jgi:hypothetical protein